MSATLLHASTSLWTTVYTPGSILKHNYSIRVLSIESIVNPISLSLVILSIICQSRIVNDISATNWDSSFAHSCV